MSTLFNPPARSLLYVPASNARALDKARGLAADLIIIDLEDAVRAEDKADARAAMRGAVAAGFAGKRVAVRVNASDSCEQAADLLALAGTLCDAIVVPKVADPADLDAVAALDKPILAMIETPAAIYAARAIAADRRVAGLVAGLNDLAHDLRLPGGSGDRSAMMLAIQAIVLAARSASKLCFDGVWNAIDDAAGFADDAAAGRRQGFDGKTLIHPAQIDPCNIIFSPSAAEIADAEALIAAATGGAQRFRGRMIEDMHFVAARDVLVRARLR